MEIFKLFGSIFIEDSEANKSIAKVEKNAKTVSERLGSGIKTAAKWGAGIAAGAGIAMGGMIALGSKVGDMADAILDLNSITGMSTDEIQKWRKATEVAGVAQDAMTSASQKLTKSLDAMSVEGQKGQEALGKLGFKLKDIEKMSADERMDALVNALAGVEDKTERARIGTDLFGGSWKEIAPVVDLGTEALKKAKDSANVISNENLVKANNFRIAMANLKDQVGFFVAEMGIGLLPMLEEFMGWIQEKMPQIKSVSKTTFDVMSKGVKGTAEFIQNSVLPILDELYQWVEPNLPAIKNFFVDAFDIIKVLLGEVKDVVKWVTDNMNLLAPAIAGVTAAIVAQMVIDGLIKLYKLWKAATATQTTAQWLLNAALNANPLGLVAMAIGAVIAVGILLYKNWDTVKQKTTELWNKLGPFKGVLLALTGPFGAVIAAGVKLYKNWDTLMAKAKEVAGKIKGFFSNMKISLPHIKMPHFTIKNWSRNPIDWLDKMPSLGVNWYAGGTDFAPGGLAVVGEHGRELVQLPRGSKVHTNDETESMLDKKEQVVIQPSPLYLDNHLIGEILFNVIDDKLNTDASMSLYMKGDRK